MNSADSYVTPCIFSDAGLILFRESLKTVDYLCCFVKHSLNTLLRVALIKPVSMSTHKKFFRLHWHMVQRLMSATQWDALWPIQVQELQGHRGLKVAIDWTYFWHSSSFSVTWPLNLEGSILANDFRMFHLPQFASYEELTGSPSAYHRLRGSAALL